MAEKNYYGPRAQARGMANDLNCAKPVDVARLAGWREPSSGGLSARPYRLHSPGRQSGE
jgi:hypothetical protein